MTDTNLDLLKKALTEGLSRKIDLVTDGYTEDVICSKKHTFAMRTILHGKIPGKHTLTPRLKWAIAIALSATLLLTGCAIKFREKIAGFFTEIFGSTIEMTYADTKNAKTTIEEEYEFTYVPEGYVLTETYTESPHFHLYTFTNSDGMQLICKHSVLTGIIGIYNNDKIGTVLKIGEYEVFCKNNTESTAYLWSNGDYAFMVTFYRELTPDEITNIENGVVKKQ